MSHCQCIGAIAVNPTQTGTWGQRGLPQSVRIGSKRFEKSLGQGRVPGTIAHYREDVDRHSAHLYVMDDGTWQITHVDEYNPHGGFLPAAKHWRYDVTQPMGEVTAPPTMPTTSRGVRDWFRVLPMDNEPFVPTPTTAAPTPDFATQAFTPAQSEDPMLRQAFDAPEPSARQRRIAARRARRARRQESEEEDTPTPATETAAWGLGAVAVGVVVFMALKKTRNARKGGLVGA